MQVQILFVPLMALIHAKQIRPHIGHLPNYSYEIQNFISSHLSRKEMKMTSFGQKY